MSMVVTASLWGWEWGTTADWFGAVGTIGAVAVALWFGRRDGRRLDAELKASAKDRAAAAVERRLNRSEIESVRALRRSEIAGRVTFHIDATAFHQKEEGGQSPVPGAAGITVSNQSDAPVFLAVLALETPTATPRKIATWATIRREASIRVSPIPKWVFSWPPAAICLYFHDGRGVIWRRDYYGGLEDLPPADTERVAALFASSADDGGPDDDGIKSRSDKDPRGAVS